MVLQKWLSSLGAFWRVRQSAMGHLTEVTPASCGDLHMARNGTRTAAPDRTRTARDGVGPWETGIGAGHPRPNPTAGECERSRWMASQTRPLAIGRCRRVLASALPGGQGRPRLPVACTLCVLVRARACSCALVRAGVR